MVSLTDVLGAVSLVFRVILSYWEALFRLVVKKAKKDVEGEIILVTGAGHGVGRALALAFAKMGTKLVLWDINEASNNTTAREVREAGGTATAFTCDVSDPDAVRSVGQRVRTEVGDVTILVNNAGILHGGAILDLTDRDIHQTYGVITLAHLWTVREFLPAMLQKNSGHVVNISSMAIAWGFGYIADYTSSKCAVFGFTDCLQDELRRLGKSGVKTSVVCSHYIDTGMTKFPKLTRFDAKMMTAQEAATMIVDGVLRNEEVIFVPAAMGLVLLLTRLLTRKARRLIITAMDAGIDPQYGVVGSKKAQ